MHGMAFVVGLIFFLLVLLDAFQTIILPRRPVGRLRITRLFFLAIWGPCRWAIALIHSRRLRDQGYSTYGPLSLLMLFVVWAVLLTTAFALMFFGLGTPLLDPSHPYSAWTQLRTCFYFSGTSLFTLGLGDVQPRNYQARSLVVLEAGVGLGFVALVIGYLPILYQAFSTREVAVALLDARAGSPPTAAELLVRHNFEGGEDALRSLLGDWERWCAEMLETHISYPILCFYRSQHDNQSWLAALTAILDTCALVIAMIDGPSTRQAQLTFAIGRHTLVDLVHVLAREKEEQILRERPLTRLNESDFARLCRELTDAGFALCGDKDMSARLNGVRQLYEPHACALADYLRLSLPPFLPAAERKPSVWMSLVNMRPPRGLEEQFTEHVSPQATASHLDGDEHAL